MGELDEGVIRLQWINLLFHGQSTRSTISPVHTVRGILLDGLRIFLVSGPILTLEMGIMSLQAFINNLGRHGRIGSRGLLQQKVSSTTSPCNLRQRRLHAFTS